MAVEGVTLTLVTQTQTQLDLQLVRVSVIGVDQNYGTGIYSARQDRRKHLCCFRGNTFTVRSWRYVSIVVTRIETDMTAGELRCYAEERKAECAQRTLTQSLSVYQDSIA